MLPIRALCSVWLLAGGPVVLSAQAPTPASSLRQFQDEIRVRVHLRGLDPAAWWLAEIRHTTEGCPLVELGRDAGGSGRGAQPPALGPSDNVLASFRLILQAQTRADTSAPWRDVDMVWIAEQVPSECH